MILFQLQRWALQGERRKRCENVFIGIWRDDRGQDLIEYALMAGFVAVAAGALCRGVKQYQRDLLEGFVGHDRCQADRKGKYQQETRGEAILFGHCLDS